MALFEQLHAETRAQGLDFLVIGGLAVNFYGYSRDTADLDLLIRREYRAEWGQLLSNLGYTIGNDAEVFVQWAPPRLGEWPVDLMLVREATFAPMLAESRQVDIYGEQLRIPSLLHLLALKLHALKHTRAHRFLKDFQDVEGLVRINQLALQSENIRQMFLKYGTLELYEKVIRACSGI